MELLTDHQVIELLYIILFRNNYIWGWGKCVCLCVGSRVVWMIMIQMSNNAVLFSVWLRIFSTSQGDGLTLPCPFIYINQTPAEVMIYLSLHLHRPPSWYPFQGPPSPCNQGNDHYHKGPFSQRFWMVEFA